MNQLEIKLDPIITTLYQEIKDMHPTDGLHSPRDLKLVTLINKKSAVLDKLLEAMKIISYQHLT